MKHMRVAGVLVLGLVLIVSCKKEEPLVMPKVIGQLVDTTGPLGQLVITFNAFSNGLALQPGSKWYNNTSSDAFTVTKFNYYVSNIQLKRDDNFIFSEKESYHLIKHVEGKTSFTISGIPSGNYNSLTFLIGVDSLRNVTGAQSGDLDVANDMFWDWNTGYIFLKLEGAYMSAGTPDPGGDYAIHVGGFDGEFSCLQKTTFNFSTPVVAKKKGKSMINYKVVVDEIFMNPQKIGMDYYYEEVVKGPKIFQDISVNYKDMFSIDKIEN